MAANLSWGDAWLYYGGDAGHEENRRQVARRRRYLCQRCKEWWLMPEGRRVIRKYCLACSAEMIDVNQRITRARVKQEKENAKKGK